MNILKKFFIFITFIFLESKKIFADQNLKSSCDKVILKEISRINKNFFNSGVPRKFLQISSNNKFIKKKTGLFEYDFEKFIKIQYDSPKSEIFFDNSNFIIHNNKRLNSIKKYKNQNPLFGMILNSSFEKLLQNPRISCLKTFVDKEKNLISLDLLVKNTEINQSKNEISFSGQKKSYFVQIILTKTFLKEISMNFSERDYIKLIF
jgi:hypothetical protein